MTTTAPGAEVTTATAALDVRDVDFSYGPIQVLFGVSLHVPAGSRIALLGTNGAGKSTLLRVIAGLATPERGTVTFEGSDVTGLAAEQRAERGLVLNIGSIGVFPTLTVEENLRIGAYPILGDGDVVQARVREVLDLFPVLGSRLGQAGGTLSGGEQQIVAFGRALVARPKVLMIDELSLGLAPLVLRSMLEVLEEVTRRGTTLLLVEQSLTLALSLTDDAYFMEKGEVRFSGPTAELVEQGDLVRAVFLGGDSGREALAAAPRPRPSRRRRPSAGNGKDPS